MLLRGLIAFIKKACCCARFEKISWVRTITAMTAFICLITIGALFVASYPLMMILDGAGLLGDDMEWLPPIFILIGSVIFLLVSHDIGYIRGSRDAGSIPHDSNLSDALDHLTSQEVAYSHTPLEETI